MRSPLNIQIYGLFIFIALICNIECYGNFSLWREGDAHETCDRVRCANKCVPVSFICDRDRDCKDGIDEEGCPNRVRVLWNIIVHSVRESVQNSLHWLQQQRTPAVGWGDDTNKAVATLFLSDSASSNETAIRDLQCAFLRRIKRERIRRLSGNEMAHYTHALLAACLNPKNFFAVNLIERMKEELNSSSPVDPFVALAVCNANGQVPNATIAKLIDILRTEQQISRTTYAFMALNCISDKNQVILEEENTKLKVITVRRFEDIMDFTLRRMIKSQQENGSYGDVYTTAIVLQVLISSNKDLQLQSIVNSSNYIFSENLTQLEDPITGAYLLLPLFSGKTLWDFGRVDCSLSPFKGGNAPQSYADVECDGYQDGDEFSEEREDRIFIRHKVENISRVSYARQSALNWLLSQRRINWGWEDDTNRAIVSLYLANNVTERFASGGRDSQLMAKQLQIHLSKLIAKKGIDSIPAHQLALYVHALLTICANPRDFWGYNLVETIKQRIDDKSESFNPFLTLALCNANETLSQTRIKELMDVVKGPDRPETTDSKAYAAMALFCIKRQNDAVSLKSENDTLRTDHLTGGIQETISANHPFEISMDKGNVTSFLKGLQHQNGGFGSVYTTALALQALITSRNIEDSWNFTKGIQYLLSKQRTDGSFGGFLSTYLVLPLLHARTLYDLGTVNCPSTQHRNLTVREEFDSISSPKQRVQCSIWLGIHKNVSFSISLTVPINKSFYDVMRLAAELDPRYRFEYFSYSWGKYIYSIFGVENDPEARTYWQVYQVEGENTTFIDKAPEEIIPGNNEQYVYWYRTKNHS